MESPVEAMPGGAAFAGSSAPRASASASRHPSWTSSECIFESHMGKPSEEDNATKIQANVGYAKSRNGIFQIIEMVLSLVGFICVESVAECRGAFNCAPPGCLHSYRFFAIISFVSVIFTGAIFSARMLGVAHRVPIPAKFHLLAECLYLLITILLYFFADAFMIAFHGNRLGYQCAAVFGVTALAAYAIQLALLAAEGPLGRLLPFRGASAQSAPGATKEDSASQLSWEPPAGVEDADGAAPGLGPVVLRPRRSSLDSGGGCGVARRQDPPDSSKSSRSSSRSSSDCAETASVHSANFVTVNLDDVTQSPGSSVLPS